jgi:hypothetical protein
MAEATTGARRINAKRLFFGTWGASNSTCRMPRM